MTVGGKNMTRPEPQLHCTSLFATRVPMAKSSKWKSSFWLRHLDYLRHREELLSSHKESTFSHSTERIFIRLIWHPSHHIWHVYSLLVWCIWRHGVSLWERWITYIREGIMHTDCAVSSRLRKKETLTSSCIRKNCESNLGYNTASSPSCGSDQCRIHPRKMQKSFTTQNHQ